MCWVWGERTGQMRLPDLASQGGVNVYRDGRRRVGRAARGPGVSCGSEVLIRHSPGDAKGDAGLDVCYWGVVSIWCLRP